MYFYHKRINALKQKQGIINTMESFCKTRGSIFLSIEDAQTQITEVKKKAGSKVVASKGTQKVKQAEGAPACVYEKRGKEHTASSTEVGATRPAPQKFKVCDQRAGRLTAYSNIMKAKHTKRPNKKENSNNKQQALPEAVLITTSGVLSYADVLKTLKNTVNSSTLGHKIKSIRQIRNQDVPIQVRNEAQGRTKLNSAIRMAIGVARNVREIVPQTEVEMIDKTTQEEEVKKYLEEFLVEPDWRSKSMYDQKMLQKMPSRS